MKTATHQREMLRNLRREAKETQETCDRLLALLLEQDLSPTQYREICLELRIKSKALAVKYENIRYHMSLMQLLENDAMLALVLSDCWEQFEKNE